MVSLVPQGLWRGRRFTTKGTSNMYRHQPLQKSIAGKVTEMLLPIHLIRVNIFDK
jgi:hypothetical protein